MPAKKSKKAQKRGKKPEETKKVVEKPKETQKVAKKSGESHAAIYFEKLERTVADVKGEVDTKIKKLEFELEEVSQFLEKSPKYQILYIINNLEECSMEKLKSLTNIDESIISLALQDLHEKDLITLSGKAENLSIKIKQKLNEMKKNE